MDLHDALGSRPERHVAFPRGLLAEADDDELTELVRRAAAELGTPIALATLVLEHIQFFKAQFGLPDDLAASRATSRDASFCQFVVRDGAPFEVADAKSDPRVPKQLVEKYSIRSYLGMPLRIGGTVVGSLCVIDTEPHAFTEAQHAALAKLAELVAARLGRLAEERERGSPAVTSAVAAPVLAEVAGMLGPLHASAGAGLMATAALASFLRLARHVHEGGETPREMMQTALATATTALEDAEDAFFNIQANVADVEDGVRALRAVLERSALPRLSELAEAGRELARASLASAGGLSLPALDTDPTLATPRALGVALVATTLSTLAARLAREAADGGLRWELSDGGAQADIVISSPLPAAATEELVGELSRSVRDEPTVSVRAAGGAVHLAFAVARPDAGEGAGG